MEIIEIVISITLVCKKMAPVQKNDTRCKKMTPVAKKNVTRCKKNVTPQKSNSHNIKLYDFYLNMIHFILNFYKKYLVVV